MPSSTASSGDSRLAWHCRKANQGVYDLCCVGNPDVELPRLVCRSSDENDLRSTPSRSEAAELARLLFW